MAIETSAKGSVSPEELEIPSWEQVLKRNNIERLKKERSPYEIINDLPRLIETKYEAINEEDIVRLQWWGLYHDKPKTGYFMLRVKIAGGLLSADQLRTIGQVANRYGKGHGEITTRQDIQLHWIRLDDLPEIFATFKAHGLTTAGGCGDVIRNITSCPVAGLQPGEVFDVRPVLREVADFFYGNPLYGDLPRKHKYTISACPAQCNAPEIHCVGLIGTRNDGRDGFAVTVGGGLSAQPRLARDLGVFVPKDQARSVLEAITGAWMENLRYRRSRAKARMKFMVDDYGTDAIREMVETRLGRRLERMEAPPTRCEADHLGVHRQQQEGYYYVGLPVPIGWLNGDQMQRLADAVEEVGGDVRLTRQQNVIVGNVSEAGVDPLTGQVEQSTGLSLKTNRVYGRSIGCTGEPFCNYSVTQTKHKLQEILDALVKRFGDRIAPLRIHLDGCPNACAQHFIGDINLTGTTVRLPDQKRMEAHDLLLRGGIGPDAAIARPVLRRIRTDQITAHLERLIAAWLEACDEQRESGGEHELSFRRFCEDRTDEQLCAIATGGADSAAA